MLHGRGLVHVEFENTGMGEVALMNEARRWLSPLTVMVMLAAACSSPGGNTKADLSEGIEAGELDLVASDATVVAPDAVPDAPDQSSIQDQVDSLDAWDMVEIEAEQVGPVPGTPGYPCINSADCLSGFCIQTNDGKQCTALCEEECPFEWSCVVYTPSLPDQVLICVPADVELCKPCMVNADCFSDEVDAGQACHDLGPAGRFCGTPCIDDEECPEAYMCADGVDASGAATRQCLIADGECACTKSAIDTGAQTVCREENESGSCPGTRICMADGLTECDAATPVTEECNGVDDDCDGELDEATGGADCLVENEHGSCPGVLVCADGELLCVGKEAAPETCDGLDNDCDLEIDEGYPDTDGDGTADCLETDKDADGVDDVDDNCPGVANPGQENADFDALGDLCDQDDDNDLTPDELDCAPTDAAIHPGAAEVCDGLDNDCSGTTDEDLGETTCGLGTCEHTVANCEVGEVQVCDPLAGVTDEICDGQDNDCNGETDEELGETTCGLGACTHTVVNCLDGQVQVCDPLAGEGVELCDAVDNDCDGETDEELGETTCGLGLCEHSVANCLDGQVQVCDSLAGQGDEVCDGLDNNCDGDVDEELGETTCGLGECDHTVVNCLDGQEQVCDSLAGQEDEVCDGLDNNCDGEVDEELGQLACGLGECNHVVDTCVDGALQVCDPLAGKDAETCDGLDNDCDGQVDDVEQLLEPCLTVLPGACAAGVWLCEAGGKGLYCQPGQLPGEVAESCANQGIDDDCNGILDDIDGLGGGCQSGEPGICGVGQWVCNGPELSCQPLQDPGSEICTNMGFDDDCDGIVDNIQGLDDECDSGKPGICAAGTQLCVNGELACAPKLEAGTESCANSGADDDCDGEQDNVENLGEACDTGFAGICTAGIFGCVDAELSCVPGIEPDEVAEVCGDDKDNDCDGGTDENCAGLSCQALYVADPGLQSGAYNLDPEGDGSYFKAYCDMKTAGGGWTLVWKQSNHESAHFTHTPSLAGNSLLLSEAYTGTTQGSIRSWFEGGELLFKSSDSMWIRLTDDFGNWTLHSGASPGRCRKLTSVPSACAGLDCGVYLHAFITLPGIIGQMSGFMIGPKHSGYPNEECSEVWCSNAKHGRYDGSCSSGPKGVGNWMLYVR